VVLLWFNVNPASGIPIYLQIMEQIQDSVIGGLLEPGEQLPSVRDLALRLTINPNTVARAYQELEKEGYIQTIKGRGSFVLAPPGGAGSQERERRVLESIERTVTLGKHLGFSGDEMVSLFTRVARRVFARESGGATLGRPGDQHEGSG